MQQPKSSLCYTDSHIVSVSYGCAECCISWPSFGRALDFTISPAKGEKNWSTRLHRKLVSLSSQPIGTRECQNTVLFHRYRRKIKSRITIGLKIPIIKSWIRLSSFCFKSLFTWRCSRISSHSLRRRAVAGPHEPKRLLGKQLNTAHWGPHVGDDLWDEEDSVGFENIDN